MSSIRVLGLALGAALTACAQPALRGTAAPWPRAAQDPAPAADEIEGVFTATLDNDLIVGDDDAYTNGFGLTWTSLDVSRETEAFQAGVADFADFLPFVDDGPTYVSVTFGQEMFTPSDIELRNPPRDEQPYAGLLFLDVAAHARDGAHDLHSYKLRVGVAGPSSGAEYAQRKVHEFIGADEPEGWDTGIKDEAVVNFYYERNRRHPLTDPAEGGLQSDVTVSGGVALGNWATSASVGATLRVGEALPDTFGVNSLRSGRDSNAVLTNPPDDDDFLFGFAGLTAIGLAHYMPLDGNTIRHSRSVDSEPWIGGAHAGFAYGSGRWITSLTLAVLTDTYDSQPGTVKFGSISVSRWY